MSALSRIAPEWFSAVATVGALLVAYSLSDIKQMGGWRTDAMPLRYIKGKPMEELQRLPAPLASIVHDFERTARRHRAGLRKAG